MLSFDIIIKGVFLIILAVCEFIAETLSCQTQKLLSDNMAAKHLITFLIIYLQLDLYHQTNRLTR